MTLRVRWVFGVITALLAAVLSSAGLPSPASAAGCTVAGSHTRIPEQVRLGDVVHVEVTVDVACNGDPLSRQFVLGVPAWSDPADADKARAAARAFVDAALSIGLEVGLALGDHDPPVEVAPGAGAAALTAALDAYGTAEGGSSVAILVGSGRALFFDDAGKWRQHLVVLDHPGVPQSAATRLRFELETTLDQGIEITHLCIGGDCPELEGTEEIAVGSLDAANAVLTPVALRPADLAVEWVKVRQSIGSLVDYVFPSANIPPTGLAGGQGDDFIEWRTERPQDQVIFEFDVRPFAIGEVVAVGALALTGQDSSGAPIFDNVAALAPVLVLPEPATPSACQLMGSAQAAPPSVSLGDPLTATLTLATNCPARPRDVDVVLAFDQSSSMEGVPQEAIRAAAERFMDRVHLDRSRVAILMFSSSVDVRTGFTQDRAALVNALSPMRFYGDTALGMAIEASRELLTNRRTSALPAMVLLTDGQVRDDPVPAAAWARAAGIRIALVCFSPTVACDPEVFDVATSQYLFLARNELELVRAYDTLGSYMARPDIERLSVIAQPSDGLAYSTTPPHANPPAQGTAGELVWNRADPLLGRTVLTYPLVARGIGTWPLAQKVTAFWVDSEGGVGAVEVPVPDVQVPAPPAEGPCVPGGTRSAAPPEIGVGEVVTVTTFLDVACEPSAAPIDVVFAVDHSYSMGTLGRLDNAVSAVDAFLEQTRDADVWQGLVAFTDAITHRVPLTPEADRVTAVLRELTPDGGTDVGRAIEAALAEVLAGRPEGQRVIVVITDGDNPAGKPILDAADLVHEAGVLLVTVCAGGRCAPDLAQAATRPEYFFNVTDAAALPGIFERLAKIVTGAEPSMYELEEEPSADFQYLGAQPDPVVVGPNLLWTFAAPPAGGVSLTHRLTSLRPGVGPVSRTALVRYTLQGGVSGTFYLPPAPVSVRSSGPRLPTAAPVPPATPEDTPGTDGRYRALLPQVAVP